MKQCENNLNSGQSKRFFLLLSGVVNAGNACVSPNQVDYQVILVPQNVSIHPTPKFRPRFYYSWHNRGYDIGDIFCPGLPSKQQSLKSFIIVSRLTPRICDHFPQKVVPRRHMIRHLVRRISNPGWRSQMPPT